MSTLLAQLNCEVFNGAARSRTTVLMGAGGSVGYSPQPENHKTGKRNDISYSIGVNYSLRKAVKWQGIGR